jgi:hypothetical protein
MWLPGVRLGVPGVTAAVPVGPSRSWLASGGRSACCWWRHWQRGSMADGTPMLTERAPMLPVAAPGPAEPHGSCTEHDSTKGVSCPEGTLAAARHP